MKPTIGDRIREAREAKKLDQASLARRIHIATRTLQRWEKGDQVPDSNYLMKLAKQMEIRPEWLLTGDSDSTGSESQRGRIIPFQRSSAMNRVPLMEVPLLSSVPAGRSATMFHPEYVERYVTVDNVKDRDAFALLVKGNSMSPRIEDGDIVVVSPHNEARTGDICVVRVNDEDVLKRVKFDEHHIHLIPLNPSFEPVTVRKRDITFVWKVVKVIKNL